MNQSYKALLGIAHRIALDVAIGTMHGITLEEQDQNQSQTAESLFIECMKPMSSVATLTELEKEKALFEYIPKNCVKVYDKKKNKIVWRIK